MAKVNHNNYLDTIDDLITDATSRGILQLHTEDNTLTGRKFKVNDRELINFGTCGYLGLEMDPRLKKAVVDYVERYGTQFSVSRTYLSSGPNLELEELLGKIYNTDVIVYPSTSSAHISVIPTIVRDRHAVIMDQQVHMSVQTGCQLLRQKGIPIEMIRHSNLEMLERKIRELGDKYEKIWYMIDGVYSMYGDVAPIHELVELMKKYDQLHLYVDDAHGMSWYGDKGAGYIFQEVGLHEKIMLVTTMAKGFGVVGGIAVFSDDKLYHRVKNFGGPLTYSHPLAPPLVGAAVASAKIHLSHDIKAFQYELKMKVQYCNELLEAKNLPVISDPRTPIFFVGMGQPKVGYNMARRLMNDGFYVNVGMFPAVPVKCTGIRFTVTRHNTVEDIEGLVNALSRHFPVALAEEGRTVNDVRKAFHLSNNVAVTAAVEKGQLAGPKMNGEHKRNGNGNGNTVITSEIKLPSRYAVLHERTIKKVDKTEWNALLGKNGIFDTNGLAFLEDSFSNKEKPEDNWDFHYFIIKDKIGKPILATFMTVGLFKDDLLAPTFVSLQIEEKRKTDPYYLTSRTIAMGCLFTEGQHMYLDRQHPDWKGAFSIFLDELHSLQEVTGAPNILLRDFETADEEFKKYLIGEGFFKIDMPNANNMENKRWSGHEEFLTTISARNRRHVRNEVFKNMHYYDVQIVNKLTAAEVDKFYDMYRQVKDRNFAINYFDYVKKSFENMNKYPNWEFLVLRIRKEFEASNPIVAICALYKSPYRFSPVVIGMDYNYVYKYQVYKQAIFQVLNRANDLGYGRISFGYTADTEKHKVGAKQIPKIAYMQTSDNFSFELLESMAAAAE